MTTQSGNRWDLQLFADRERQEKFNKLMVNFNYLLTFCIQWIKQKTWKVN